MATAAATYLYALAGLSVSFVGFSTLLIVFRQSAGGRLTHYDSYFVLTFMQAGFIVSAGARGPPPPVLPRVARGRAPSRRQRRFGTTPPPAPSPPARPAPGPDPLAGRS